jgi:hypothetical protein
MPKNAKRSKNKKAIEAPAQADEKFDVMLAELCATDPIVTNTARGVWTLLSHRVRLSLVPFKF